MYVRIARKHVQGVTVAPEAEPLPKDVVEKALKQAKKALIHARYLLGCNRALFQVAFVCVCVCVCACVRACVRAVLPRQHVHTCITHHNINALALSKLPW
jgi:hypothetical protein